tara:strand:- start:316 stop:465 length:150 start_codon:yes stop_codon:yes gene_type:complete
MFNMVVKEKLVGKKGREKINTKPKREKKERRKKQKKDLEIKEGVKDKYK